MRGRARSKYRDRPPNPGHASPNSVGGGDWSHDRYEDSPDDAPDEGSPRWDLPSLAQSTSVTSPVPVSNTRASTKTITDGPSASESNKPEKTRKKRAEVQVYVPRAKRQQQQLLERQQHQQQQEYEHQQPQQHHGHHNHLRHDENQQQSSLQHQQHGSQSRQEQDSVCDMDGNEIGSAYILEESFQFVSSEDVDTHENKEQLGTKPSEIIDKDKCINMEGNETNDYVGKVDKEGGEGVEKLVNTNVYMKQKVESVTWHTMNVNKEVLDVEGEEMEFKTGEINEQEKVINMKDEEIDTNVIDMMEDKLYGRDKISEEEDIPSKNSIDSDARNGSEIEQLCNTVSDADNAVAYSTNCVTPDLSSNVESTEYSVTHRDDSAIDHGPSFSETEVTFPSIDTMEAESETIPENCDITQDVNVGFKLVDTERQQISLACKTDSNNMASEGASVTFVAGIATDKGSSKEKKKTKVKPAKLGKKKKAIRESEEGDTTLSEKLTCKAPQITKEKKVGKVGSVKVGTKSLDEDLTGSDHRVNAEEEDDEDDWFSKFNDEGDCLDEDAMEELTRVVGEVKIEKSQKINYLDYQPRDKADMDFDRYNHIIEIYDFPAEFVTRDLITAFQAFMSRGFDLKWVDDTHALGIFNSPVAAQDALNSVHPLLKTCPLTMASKQSKLKAKRCTEFLQPYKPRPETTAAAARRLVAGALGIATNVSKEKRDRERQQLKEAKEKRRQERTNREQIWEYGKCAMDEEGNT
ncbi:uncharacterized protein LOC127858433 isoform X1 [Dreissena polymorpha]|uniref:uncharacterized protein LOC127858433 isoform X1 n=1 Tax=Dreissena polymorpha TaxID=45954 RepID=UPI002264C98B|nr:uncharacterized protein LOC127858433 isoform X1 [Dreissena polymorpha]